MTVVLQLARPRSRAVVLAERALFVWAQVDIALSRAKVDMEMMISEISAVFAFKIMVPAAVSLAPGIIRGALKVKSLVPQSSIPGSPCVLTSELTHHAVRLCWRAGF